MKSRIAVGYSIWGLGERRYSTKTTIYKPIYFLLHDLFFKNIVQVKWNTNLHKFHKVVVLCYSSCHDSRILHLIRCWALLNLLEILRMMYVCIHVNGWMYIESGIVNKPHSIIKQQWSSQEKLDPVCHWLLISVGGARSNAISRSILYHLPNSSKDRLNVHHSWGKKDLSRTWIYVCRSSTASSWSGQISFWFMSVVPFTEITETSRRHWRLVVSLAQTTSSDTNSITKLRPAAIYRWLSVWLRHHSSGNLSAGHWTAVSMWYHMDSYNHSSPSRHNNYWANRQRERGGWIRKRDPEPQRDIS